MSSLAERSRESGAGIRLSFDGKPGDIVADGNLYNRRNGFSQYIRFIDAALHFSDTTLRSHFVLLGRQRASDGFPASVSFHSVVAVRNIVNKTVIVTPEFKRSRAGTVDRFSLSPLSIAAGDTKLLDLTAEKARGRLPSDFDQGSLELVPQSDQNSIIAEMLNYNEETGGYVVASSFSAFPNRGTGSIWRLDGTFQTTLMVENTSSDSDEMTLRLFSGDLAYEKTYPIAAGQIIKISFRDLLQGRIPDDTGRVLQAPSGTLSMAGKGVKSRLSYDKLIYSADESEYVGLGGSACSYVTQIGLFLNGTADPNVWDAMLDTFWSDNSFNEGAAVGTTSENNSLASVDTNGVVTFHPIDGFSHDVTLDYSQVEIACVACSSDDYQASTVATVPPRPACPASIAVSSSSAETLANIFPGTKTGVGIMASMLAQPTNINWNGIQLTEQVTIVSTTCPSNFSSSPLNLCQGSSSFVVGDNGLTAVGVDGSRFSALTNIFHDEHTATSSVSLLDAANPPTNSCQVVCRQQYTCGGAVKGTFNITYSFSKGTLQQQPVTNVSATKQ